MDIGKIYVIYPIKYEYRYIAETIYSDVLTECLQDSCVSKHDQAFELILFRQKLPFNYKENLEKDRKSLDNKKVELYEIAKEKGDTANVRKEIEELDNRIGFILGKLHCMDSITAEGVAEIEKSRYILKKSLKKKVSNTTLEMIMGWLARNSITEKDYRKIARSGQFFNIVNSAGSSLFKNYPLTDEQMSLMYWYRFYKNVLESQDRPFEWIIDDDLALDGWYIQQSRKAAKTESINYVEGKIHSDAVRGSQEVYVIGGAKMAETVYNANDASGRAYIKAKQGLINKGKLNESTDNSLGKGFGIK